MLRTGCTSMLVATALLLGVSAALFPGGAARAEGAASAPRLAVLEFRGGAVEPALLTLLADAARTGALQGAEGRPLSVMTRENVLVLLEASGVKLEDCEGACEVETGRRLGVDFLVSGDVAAVERELLVTVRLYETASGVLLASRQIRGATQLGLIADLAEATGAAVRARLERVQAAPKRRQVLTFGMQPQWSREQMQRMFGPLMRYLSEKTGHEFRLRVTEDYGALLDEMNSGLIDIGKFSPYGYVLAKKTNAVRLFATELTNGRPWYRGYVIVRKDSGLRSIDDLRGKRFSYTDPNSTSGFIYPRALLVERGIDPNGFFKEVHYAGSHDVCIRGVAGGKIDAGATWDVALEDESDSKLLGVNGDELAIIHRTEKIPNDGYAARAGLDEAVVDEIQRALLELSRDKKKLGEVIDWKTRIDGFVPGDDAAYEVVREKVALKDLKPRLAVLTFDQKGTGFGDGAPGVIAADLLGARLFDSQRFLVIERAQIDKALADQQVETAIAGNAAEAARLGRVVGATLLLAGSVMKLGGTLHVTWRLIEAQSGRVLYAQHAKGAALDEVVERVVAQVVSNYDVRGFVLKSQGTENVTVDLGSLQGLRAGDPLILYKQGETLTHPITGKVLGAEEVVLGQATTVRTTPEISFAKVLGSTELVQQGFRVRSLRKDERAPSSVDGAAVVAGYLDDQRKTYEPWPLKYAWRVAALASIPAVFALLDGSDRSKLTYGGVALGLWAITGGVQLYYSRSSEPARRPSYLEGPQPAQGAPPGHAGQAGNEIGLRGSF